MKKSFAIIVALFITFYAFAVESKTILYEETYINNQEGLYWEFTVPKNSEAISIDCSTSAEFSWKMKFVLVPTKEDAIKFCAGQGCSYIKGTYTEKAQKYSICRDDLEPGQTYYFCAFNDTYGITAAKQYKIIPIIKSYYTEYNYRIVPGYY